MNVAEGASKKREQERRETVGKFVERTSFAADWGVEHISEVPFFNQPPAIDLPSAL
jgi:hypothetical protein